jgi:phage baseplate assembly protein W
MTISFKDVGVKKEEVRQSVLAVSQSLTPIGIRTPLEIDSYGKELFVMNYKVPEQVKDNLRNLLLTNHGDRVIMYDFGANINPLAAEYSSKDDFDSEVMIRINTAISKYMSFVTPLEFDSVADRETNQYVGKIEITIIYAVPALNIFRDQLDLIIHII